mmetsp:Transcript_115143/g.321854  ORF Transcript_115143/g.321854 Transcript_115143/m.321854 type:complete len:241 (+) Transcript_115143:168-890(+)
MNTNNRRNEIFATRGDEDDDNDNNDNDNDNDSDIEDEEDNDTEDEDRPIRVEGREGKGGASKSQQWRTFQMIEKIKEPTPVGLVHHDIKPSNIFFVAHPRFGVMCKIGDFGMAGESGSSADGLEGDTRYMPPELLALGNRHPSGDIFSLGLTIYEIATDEMTEMPSEGPQRHFLRSSIGPTLPKERGVELLQLVQAMTDPNELKRPTANTILKSRKVVDVGHGCDHFLRDYIHDIEAFES